MVRRFRIIGVLLLFVAVVAVGLGVSTSASARTDNRQNGSDFVRRVGPELLLHGKLFRFAGTNNYYLSYSSQFMANDVLQTAAGQGFDVLRTWGFMDQSKNGVQFQSFDATAGKPTYDDGPNGLQHLDYVIAQAGKLGLKLVIPFTNNWSDFGGMDQFVQWRATSAGSGTWYHDSFYTDPVIKNWYQAWISHLLNHVNFYTGVKYKDDPTIMTWELGNEPRCVGSGGFATSSSCTTNTLIRWADEMSTYVKSIDRNHLVSVGDEGFYCNPSATFWTDNCSQGVDTVAFARLRNIDVMSFHLYPDSWGTTPAWGTQWIQSHFAAALRVGKPAMLGEFGLKDDTAQRNVTYQQWLDAVLRSGGAGALYWILSGHQDDGSLYPDYDGFTVYCPSPVCTTITNFGKEMAVGHQRLFPPVADNNAAVTEFETAITLNAAGNDIAYNGASIVKSSLDLDPSTPGKQTTITVIGGMFVANADGTVLFTPAAQFSGTATAQYTIKDNFGRTSNAATLTVKVKPNPTGILPITSYEDGTAGATGGIGATLTQSGDWADDGTHSLRIDVPAATEGWINIATFSAPPDLTGKITLEVDLHTTGTQTYRKASIQVGDASTWCEGKDGNTPASTTDTVSVDLTACAGDLSKLQAVNIYLQGGSTGATYYIDNIRAE